jgi:hypothetical protein
MLNRIAGAAGVIALVLAATLHAADATGTWTASFQTQAGEQQYTYTFVVKGTTLTGTAKGNLVGESTITDGKVNGSMISFVENAKYQGMDFRIEYTGTLTSDNELKLTRKVADIATEELVAKRVK